MRNPGRTAVTAVGADDRRRAGDPGHRRRPGPARLDDRLARPARRRRRTCVTGAGRLVADRPGGRARRSPARPACGRHGDPPGRRARVRRQGDRQLDRPGDGRRPVHRSTGPRATTPCRPLGARRRDRRRGLGEGAPPGVGDRFSLTSPRATSCRYGRGDRGLAGARRDRARPDHDLAGRVRRAPSRAAQTCSRSSRPAAGADLAQVDRRPTRTPRSQTKAAYIDSRRPRHRPAAGDLLRAARAGRDREPVRHRQHARALDLRAHPRARDAAGGRHDAAARSGGWSATRAIITALIGAGLGIAAGLGLAAIVTSVFADAGLTLRGPGRLAGRARRGRDVAGVLAAIAAGPPRLAARPAHGARLRVGRTELGSQREGPSAEGRPFS